MLSYRERAWERAWERGWERGSVAGSVMLSCWERGWERGYVPNVPVAYFNLALPNSWNMQGFLQARAIFGFCAVARALQSCFAYAGSVAGSVPGSVRGSVPGSMGGWLEGHFCSMLT